MKGKIFILLVIAMWSVMPASAHIFPLMQTNVQTKKILDRPTQFINYVMAQRKMNKSWIYKFHIKQMGRFPFRNKIRPKNPFGKRLGKGPTGR